MRSFAVLLSSTVLSPLATLAVTPSVHAEPPDQLFVTTESGKARCMIETDRVGCQGGFANAPIEHGYPDNNVWIYADEGELHWNQSNMASTGYADMRNDLVLTYGQVFHLNGWTVEPSSTGTRFTNDDTRRGMFVSVQAVTAF